MGEHVVSFFGCLYFAGMLPGEALSLRGHNCMLPQRGWGRTLRNRSRERVPSGRMTGVIGRRGG